MRLTPVFPRLNAVKAGKTADDLQTTVKALPKNAITESVAPVEKKTEVPVKGSDVTEKVAEMTPTDAVKTSESKTSKEVRKLKPVAYFSEVIRNFGQLYSLESAFLEEANAYVDDNGSIRIRVQSDIAATMLAGAEVFDALLRAFNAFEGGRLNKNTLLIETIASAKKNSYIDEIIDAD